MAETSNRSGDFDVVRRGYDRAQVDTRMAELETELDRLRADLDRATASGLAIGIDEQEALAAELHTIGGEVADILEAARTAAEGMRRRAASDASEWREEAQTESAEMVRDATEQSQSMRASAWNEGSSLLGSAAAEAQAIIDRANEDALFVRAEAEREAIRLTGDAKRDREELLRAARSESAQMIEQARLESEGVLAAAAKQAELAQERARALEDRRSELLSELEATRASIGELEVEIESRRQELEEPTEPEVEEANGDGRTHHASDGGSVRIVAPTRAVELKPVDADELMAEVQALRDGGTEPERLDPQPIPEVVVEPEPDVSSIPESSAASIQEAEAEVPEVEAAAEPVEDDRAEVDVSTEPSTSVPTVADDALAVSASVPEPEAEPDAASERPSGPPEEDEPDVEAERPTEVSEQVDAAPAVETPPEPEPEPAPEKEADVETADTVADDDVLGSLFAQLRTETSVEAPPEPTRSADDETADEPTVELGAIPIDPANAEPAPVPEVPTMEPTPAPASVGDADDEPSTIPAQNLALRSIKRTLVDLQNETLDHLRTDAAWDPAEGYTDRFGPAFSELNVEVWGIDDPAVADAFAVDLHDALQSALERSRASGGGERAVASAASKVFRMWRSDEAEQRVVQAARTQPVSA